jgi:hypothetical protein
MITRSRVAVSFLVIAVLLFGCDWKVERKLKRDLEGWWWKQNNFSFDLSRKDSTTFYFTYPSVPQYDLIRQRDNVTVPYRAEILCEVWASDRKNPEENWVLRKERYEQRMVWHYRNGEWIEFSKGPLRVKGGY